MKALNPLLFLLSLMGLFACQSSDDPAFDRLLEEGTQFDLLLQNGRIIDGSGGSSFPGDVLIKNDEIVFVGLVDTARVKVAKKIGAAGRLISPGFIDAHAHGDPLRDTSMINFLAMGVTSIVLGQDGSSPNYLAEKFSGPEEWLNHIDQNTLPLNVAYLLGHGSLRRMAQIPDKEKPSETQLEEMKVLLREAMEAGFFGMSTGLEYIPGIFASEEELIALAQTIGSSNGLVMSHMRNEDEDSVEASIQELLRQGAHCRVHISHLKVVYGKGPERAREILSLIDQAHADGIFLSADVYPYMASYTGIGILFPSWAKTNADFEKARRTRKKELKDYLYQRVQKRNGPQATLFGTGTFAGKTLAEVAEETGKSYVDVLMDMGPNGASGAYFIMDESLQEQFIASPLVLFSTDGSPKMRHPRGYGSFAKIIERYVWEKQLLSLELAIHKMTDLTARTIGLEKRGRIEEGYKADLLIFDEMKVKANATYDDPFQLAEGFDVIIINGKVVRENGDWRKVRAGSVLRKSGSLK